MKFWQTVVVQLVVSVIYVQAHDVWRGRRTRPDGMVGVLPPDVEFDPAAEWKPSDARPGVIDWRQVWHQINRPHPLDVFHTDRGACMFLIGSFIDTATGNAHPAVCWHGAAPYPRYLVRWVDTATGGRLSVYLLADSTDPVWSMTFTGPVPASVVEHTVREVMARARWGFSPDHEVMIERAPADRRSNRKDKR